ncbi:MAG: insulinase family protein [Alphaproteobacteria bacterium]|nr:insulinase family protein [Alphaproteobacteria bacterium]
MKAFFIGLLLFFSFDLCAKYNVTADFTLSNGLRVICIEKKGVPVVSCIVYYKCGSTNDALSKSGVAHYLEHMAFFNNHCAFSDFLESIGAEFNAFTSNRLVCFEEVVPIEHIETVLKNEAERMNTFDIDIEKFRSEKGAILEERSMRTDNDPFGQCQELETAYVFHEIPIIGWRNEIESITPEDLVNFRNKWFAPNNAIILLAGDIEVKKIKKLIEKYFGDIQKKEIQNLDLIVVKEKPQITKEIEFRSTKIGTSASVSYLYFVPPDIKQDFRKRLAFILAGHVLNEPQSLFRSCLEHNLNKADGIYFAYNSTMNAFSVLDVSISCSSIDNLEESERIFGYLIKKLLAKGISQKELDLAKRQSMLADAYAKEDIASITHILVHSFAAGYTLDQIQKMDDVIQSITLEECNSVLKEVLTASPIAILRMLPKEHDRD